MQSSSFLLYGANGYSGELIARFAHQYGLQPVLAGRNTQAVKALAQTLQLPFRTLELDDKAAWQDALRGIKLVVNAAGPYNFTAKPVIAACMAAQAHYLDLNGDTEVFEILQQFNDQAIEKNIMVLPGAGFDVVPTDCLARWLKDQLPNATHLQIAFVIIGSGLSRGTAITTLQKLGLPGAVRKNGRLVPEPIGKRGMWVEFPDSNQKSFMMSIPWGDISTAYFSTGIPNIETYTGIPKSTWWLLKGQVLFNWLLRTPFVHSIIRKIINSRTPGPGDEKRDKAVSLVWAKVTNDEGHSLTARMRCPEAYSLTAASVLLMSAKILGGDFKPGYQTPASAYGPGLIMEI
ncbi:MAG: saccharopine dehydrogenase NADP-binding domain-containing protein, partial [Bacteroidota bacterium]